MKNTNKVFDALVDTQAQMVDNFNEVSKKFQETFVKNETFEKSTAYFQEQLAAVQGNLEQSFAQIKKQMSVESFPEQVKEVVEATENLGKAWFECFRATVQAKSAEDLSEIVNANFKKAQESFKEVYSEVTEKMTKMPDVSEAISAETFKKNFHKAIEFFKPVYNLK